MNQSDVQRLSRILGLMSSEHAGERASAAQAASAFVEKHGTSWEELLRGSSDGKGLRRRDIGIDYVEAAESRMRQLRAENTRLMTELKRAKAKLAAIADAERRERMEDVDEN